MSKIKCIIIEDEPLAQERVRGYVSKIPNLELIGSFENGIDALFFLKSNEVDLLFLDINIGEFNGIQFAETLKNPIQIIITTAYPEYALKGFDLNVTDYLLKPFTFDRFIQAVERVQLKPINELQALKSYIFIKTEGRFYGQCSELCGTNHGVMPIVVEAVELEPYCEWLNSKLAG